ncbi:Dihydroorotate dehydrogenase (quinone), mitochondrial [Ophidiomyces ophidiicola]|nr:Dihydroorotate dehydrogenase (quinone), mitochondrial [Ophidiomyces ophidiicola]
MTDTRASAHRYVVPPLVRWMYPDAEDAHHAGVRLLQRLYGWGLHPRERGCPDADGKLVTEVFGHTLSNPIGISGGLDKDAEIPDALFALGPAVVEVGGCTPRPQDGNPRPRVFRIASQNALINRYGLNSQGAAHMAGRLRRRVRAFARAHGFSAEEMDDNDEVAAAAAGVPVGSLAAGRLLAVQIAKNKTTPDSDMAAVERDYVWCAQQLARYADILVVNVSSPNTPGLRDLQRTAPLTQLLTAVVGAAAAEEVGGRRPAVMVKVSPDEDSDEQVRGICAAVRASGVDGVIVGNTTNGRAVGGGGGLSAAEQVTLGETGGFSGPALFERTVALVGRYRRVLDEQRPGMVLFASGGITDGRQAAAVLNAGASVAMVYTGLVYGGSGTITRIKDELRATLTGPAEECV